jgi:hypothetical protein
MARQIFGGSFCNVTAARADEQEGVCAAAAFV